MREIEVKARVTNIGKLLDQAQRLGITFGDPIRQDDTTYETSLPTTDPQWNIFRIRKQNSTVILTMKYIASSRSRDHHERETVINDAEQVADMLARVGYTEGIRICKDRRIAHYRDLEICLDEVDELGTFIEVEKLAEDNADVDAVQAELWDVLLQLGIKPSSRVHEGYDTLMYAQRKTLHPKK